MSSLFTLTRVLLVLDSRVLYNQEATRERALPHWIFLSMAGNTPGEHVLQVLTQMRGEFYLRGYKFEVKSSHAFTVSGNRPIRVEVVAWEKRGPRTPPEQRPAIRYVEQLEAPLVSPRPSATEPADGSPGPSPPSEQHVPVP